MAAGVVLVSVLGCHISPLVRIVTSLHQKYRLCVDDELGCQNVLHWDEFLYLFHGLLGRDIPSSRHQSTLYRDFRSSNLSVTCIAMQE